MSRQFRQIAVAGLTAFTAFFMTIEAEADPLVIKAPAYVPQHVGAPAAAPAPRVLYPEGRWHARRAARRAVHARGHHGYGYRYGHGYAHAHPAPRLRAGWSGCGHACRGHAPVAVAAPGWGDTPFRSDPKVIYNTPGGLTEIAAQARRVEEIYPVQAFAPFYR